MDEYLILEAWELFLEEVVAHADDDPVEVEREVVVWMA